MQTGSCEADGPGEFGQLEQLPKEQWKVIRLVGQVGVLAGGMAWKSVTLKAPKYQAVTPCFSLLRDDTHEAQDKMT